MMSEGRDGRSSRDRLLAGAISYFAANGTSDVSLRSLAAALGTSHRMLIYHFGSKEGLLVGVVKEVERRQREVLSRLLVSGANEGIDRDFWRHVSDRHLHPFARLFFEVYGQALQHRSWAEPLLDGVVDDWVEPVAAALTARGVSTQDARTEARLAVAVTRGLLLDLLATGERGAVDAAADLFLSRYERAPDTSKRTGDRNMSRSHPSRSPGAPKRQPRS
jgi:AcrR family transcriptional regulator